MDILLKRMNWQTQQCFCCKTILDAGKRRVCALVDSIGVFCLPVIKVGRLFAADEADAEGYGTALAAGEGAEIGGVEIVDDGVGILAVEGVDGFDANSPEEAAEGEFFFDSEVEAGIDGKAHGVGRADELLLEVDDAEGEAGAVLVEIAELDAPDVSGSPAPGEEAVGGIPGDGGGLLRGVEDRTEGGVENFIGVGDGARVSAIDFHALGENVAEGESGGAVAVLASVLEEKNAAGLRGLLGRVDEAVRTVAGEECEGEEGVVDKFLLPAGAGGGEARLMEAACGKKELVCDGRTDDGAGGVEEGVELLLIESLADERKIQRGVVNAPADGDF